MHRYTVGTQLGQLKGGAALGDLLAARGDWFSPPQLFTVPFRKYSGNTQWRVCLLAHTLLLCSWFRDSVHSRYTVGTQLLRWQVWKGPRAPLALTRNGSQAPVMRHA